MALGGACLKPVNYSFLMCVYPVLQGGGSLQARLDLQFDFQSREVTAIANPRTSFQLGPFICHGCAFLQETR